MFVVFWCQTDFNGTLRPYCKEFKHDEMSLALTFMQEMRTGIDKDAYRFINMSSENPNQVGKMGVSDPSPDYNWTKRRYNERPVTKGNNVTVVDSSETK